MQNNNTLMRLVLPAVCGLAGLLGMAGKAQAQTACSLATLSGSHPGHGTFHPVAWCQYYDGGRVFATTLGHDITAWSPGNEQFKSLVVNGIMSAAGLTPFCTR